MASFEDLETAVKQAETEEDAYEKDDEESGQLEYDVRTALALLIKCTHLLNYMSDADLCRSVTKRERESMLRLSDQVQGFVDEVEPSYIEEE